MSKEEGNNLVALLSERNANRTIFHNRSIPKAERTTSTCINIVLTEKFSSISNKSDLIIAFFHRS